MPPKIAIFRILVKRALPLLPFGLIVMYEASTYARVLHQFDSFNLALHR